MGIPRIIHYCWLSDDPLPENIKRYVEGWKKILPAYKFVKWDLSKFDRDSSLWVREAVERKKYAFASDYIRLWAVYRYGGIYLDMDVEVLKAFDPLLERPYMFAFETPDRSRIEAGCFGAEKHDPFIKACLAYYKDRHFAGRDGLQDTRPLSKVMADILQKKKFDLRIYPWKTFTAKSFSTGEEFPGKNSYAIHHFAGSWKSAEELGIIERARRIRKTHPLCGKPVAFVYEKVSKALLTVRKGGVKELCLRMRQYIRR